MSLFGYGNIEWQEASIPGSIPGQGTFFANFNKKYFVLSNICFIFANENKSVVVSDLLRIWVFLF